MANRRAEDFWRRCREVHGVPEHVRWHPRRLGSSPEICAMLVELIRSGQKTGTFSLLAEFEANDQPEPRTGDHLVVTDYDGRPGCCVRLDAVELLPFARIDAAWVRVEGPALRDLAQWRRLHQEYWTPMLAGWGRQFHEDEPILCQRFGPPFVP